MQGDTLRLSANTQALQGNTLRLSANTQALHGDTLAQQFSQHSGIKCMLCYKTLGGGLRREAKFTGLSSKSFPRLTHPTFWTFNF
jgi:hypothetical protein